jgi:hypothetical protein
MCKRLYRNVNLSVGSYVDIGAHPLFPQNSPALHLLTTGTATGVSLPWQLHSQACDG